MPRVTRFAARQAAMSEGGEVRECVEREEQASWGWQVGLLLLQARGIFHGTNVASHKITMRCVPLGVCGVGVATCMRTCSARTKAATQPQPTYSK